LQAGALSYRALPIKENPEMKQYIKLVLLVIFALSLTLTACQRPASRAPVNTPTPGDEVPFPFDTQDAISIIRTQTAIALNPPAQPTETAVVQVETVAAPQEEQQQQEEAQEGGGIQATATQAPAEQQSQQVEIPEVTRPSTYTLQRGEWPICIARRYNLELSSFLSMNGMNMNSKPAVGTVLRIPSSGTWSAAHGSRALKPHPTTYTVAAGDTIYTIACSYGDVAPEQILAANGLSNASEIQAGMQLQIP